MNEHLDVAKLEGTLISLNYVESLIIGCLNYNAESLAAVMKKLEELEKQIEEMKGATE